MEWFLAYSAGILRGSMVNTDDTTQLIWIKYMAMANEAKDPESGRLEYKKGLPYEMEYISTVCKKSIEEILKAEALFMQDLNKDGVTPRLTIEPDGTRVLSNWSDKQNRKGEQRPIRVKKTQTQKDVDAAKFAISNVTSAWSLCLIGKDEDAIPLLQQAMSIAPEAALQQWRDLYLDKARKDYANNTKIKLCKCKTCGKLFHSEITPDEISHATEDEVIIDADCEQCWKADSKSKRGNK